MGYGVRADTFWMVKSIPLIDFNMDCLLYESIFINRVIPGCFSYSDLSCMEFEQYEKVLQRAREINGKE